ncbi:hypothetical protein B484DRAFT_450623 [Ochromonadaceae sp. CCMP2298]|nr:hypothetical protein B484DRAFT_450623 [Ochromonadaceae sp. CCMP2298]
MEKKVIELNVGGTIFRTTHSTLCTTPYFANMIEGNWSESQGAPIFIDRDPIAFDGILSYLRCNRVILSGANDDAYLERLAIEADFYLLGALGEGVSSEIERRKMLNVDTVTDHFLFKSVGATEANRFFDLGWSYVDKYQGNECTACSSSGSKVEAHWRGNHCTACGEMMSFEKFSKHVTFFNPTMLVLKKEQVLTARGAESARGDLVPAGSLEFDQSFG